MVFNKVQNYVMQAVNTQNKDNNDRKMQETQRTNVIYLACWQKNTNKLNFYSQISQLCNKGIIPTLNIINPKYQ